MAADLPAVEKATGEMVAVNQDTGAVEWDTRAPVLAVRRRDGDERHRVHHQRFQAVTCTRSTRGTGKILLKTPLSRPGPDAPRRRSTAYYVIAGGGRFALVQVPARMIIAYKLGATGKLPDTVGS